MAIAVEHAQLGENFSNSITTSITVTTTAAVASGGFIVIAAQWFDPTEAVGTVTFSGGGLTWTTDKYARDNVTFDPSVAIGSAQAPSGLASSTVITMTVDASVGGQTCQIGCSSFTGVKTSSPVDGTPLGPTTVATAAWSTGNYAITAGSMIYACFSNFDVFTNTMSAGTEAWEQASAFTNGGGAYRIEPSAGSYAVAGTFSSAGDNTNAAVAYLAAPTTGLATADFEAGTHGSTVAVADPGSATAWNDVTVGGGSESVKYDNTHSYGLLACKIISGGGSATVEWTTTALGTTSDHYGRLYMWFDSNPSGATLRLAVTSPGYVGLFLHTSGLLGINLYNGGGLNFTTPIALGQWVRLEWHAIHSTTAGQVEARLFNSPDSATPTETTATSASADTGPSISGMLFGVGSGTAPTATLWLDNIVAGATSWPGPEGGLPETQSFYVSRRRTVGR